jgi:DNA replicative helicase MCM subunit Mcm2 (Cdc46/Mcm family)
LAVSLAPNIFENEDTKKAVLLQLFGGTNKTFAKSESTKFRYIQPCASIILPLLLLLLFAYRLFYRLFSFALSLLIVGRGNIHVLLCGDPATSKSQILQVCISSLAFIIQYSTGKLLI